MGWPGRFTNLYNGRVTRSLYKALLWGGQVALQSFTMGWPGRFTNLYNGAAGSLYKPSQWGDQVALQTFTMG